MTELEKQTILATLRNGLGLTYGCKGIHRDPREVSNFINENELFQAACRTQLIAGYQTLIVAMNDAGHKKSWDRWRAQRGNIELFIMGLNLWESLFTAKDWSFENFTMAIRECKTVPETATAMGMLEREIWQKIYQDAKLVQWLMQNNFQV